MSAASDILSEAHYIWTEGRFKVIHTLCEHLKWYSHSCVPTCTAAQDHTWLSFRISSSIASCCYSMHGEATTRIQSDGNPSMGEQDWNMLFYKRFLCYSKKSLPSSKSQIHYHHSSGLQKLPLLRLMPVQRQEWSLLIELPRSRIKKQ